MITDDDYYASLLRKMRKPLRLPPETVEDKARLLDCVFKKEPMLMMGIFIIGLAQSDMFKQSGIKLPPMSGGLKQLWDMLIEPGVAERLTELFKERGVDVG